MRLSARLWSAVVLSSIQIGCVSPSREGLPPDSPFRERVVLAADLLPQGIAVGDVTATSALIWVRTEGPAFVQVEWAQPSVWKQVLKMATVIAPVARTPRLATTSDTDYTLGIPLEGLLPATSYRYHVMIGKGDAKRHIEAKLAAEGEFSTLPGPSTTVSVTLPGAGIFEGKNVVRRALAAIPSSMSCAARASTSSYFSGTSSIATMPVPLLRTNRALISSRRRSLSIAYGIAISAAPTRCNGFSIPSPCM